MYIIGLSCWLLTTQNIRTIENTTLNSKLIVAWIVNHISSFVVCGRSSRFIQTAHYFAHQKQRMVSCWQLTHLLKTFRRQIIAYNAHDSCARDSTNRETCILLWTSSWKSSKFSEVQIVRGRTLYAGLRSGINKVYDVITKNILKQ